MNPLISFIIPCYNQELLLGKCLESIQKQSYDNWQCILIDDGSTDQTGSIAKKWEDEDLRFKYIYKQNGGASSARNLGLQESTGDFVYFIDSDDYLYSDHALEIFTKEIDAETDVICGNFFFINKSDSHFFEETGAENSIEILEGTEILKNYLERKTSGLVANKMIRRSCILENKLLFNETMTFSEDFEFYLRLFSTVRKIKKIPAYTYVYNRANENSATAKNSVRSNLWYDSQIILMESIAHLNMTSPRWQKCDPAIIIQYFSHQYHFLKENSLWEQSQNWKRKYNEIRKIYANGKFNEKQKRFKYNACLAHYAMVKTYEKKNAGPFQNILKKFITF